MIRETSAASSTFLVTGGAGFIGSHLCERLLAEGHAVIAVDDLSTGNPRNLSGLREHPQFTFAQGSIRDEAFLDSLARQSQVIVHLAAMVGVQQIMQRPAHTLETNIFCTHAVLNAARVHGCRVLLASTSELYGKSREIPFREQDDVVLGATTKLRWGYAAGKMLDEFLALSYHQDYSLETVVFRLFNTVGPRQSGHAGMVIPRLVRQALQGESLTIYGDGSQTRCFCDVRDVVRAISGLSQHPLANGNVYNIGGTEEITMLNLAQQVKEVLHVDVPISLIPYADAFPVGFEDPQRRVPDLAAIEKLLAWRPEISLRETLQDVAKYQQQMSD